MFYSGSNPVQIALPADLAGMSLETRLTTYDWDTNFELFQRVTRKGSFKPMCMNAKGSELTVSVQSFIRCILRMVLTSCVIYFRAHVSSKVLVQIFQKHGDNRPHVVLSTTAAIIKFTVCIIVVTNMSPSQKLIWTQLVLTWMKSLIF